MRKTWLTALLIACIWLFVATPSLSQEKPTDEGRDRRRNPLEKRDMEAWEKIPFDRDRFGDVTRGMTEEDVLNLLGKPRRVEKEHRRRNRYTVHYFYPGGYIVNFIDGLVVGTKHDPTAPRNPWDEPSFAP